MRVRKPAADRHRDGAGGGVESQPGRDERGGEERDGRDAERRTTAVARRIVRSMRCRSPGVVETRRAPVAWRASETTLTTMRAPSTDENWPNWSGPRTRALARVSP